MHPALLDSDEIDYNLYPALVQVFAIVFIGYLAGSFELITKPQALGLNKFVSKFALPALLFKSIVVLDFSSVNWLFLTSIFFSKAIVFISAICIAVITIRPINIGQAAIFAIYVSQSNDFALGAPIINAVYGKTHPDYLHYIYLLAPISLCILNPFGFLMMEANEIITENKKQQSKTNTFIDDKNSDSGSNEAFEEAEIDDNNNNKELENLDAISSVDTTNKTSADLDSSSLDFSNLVDQVQIKRDFRNNAATVKCSVSKSQLIKSTIWSTISNPIVFMTVIGIVANFVLKQKIPSLIEPILKALADSFSAIALFFLGYTMIGKIKNLTFSTVIIILVLVFAKSLVFPLITREIVLHIHNFYNQTSANETESLSTFSFLYGTFPAAPSLFFYMSRYKYIGEDVISSALVFGTLASAPLMMISGKMISIKYNDTYSSNIEDIECKTAYGFSILTWFSCIWVLYIFVVSGRALAKLHRYTLFLIVAQMANALVHIIWSSMETNNPLYGYLHVVVALFFAFLTKCWLLTMTLSLFSIIGRINKYNKFRSNHFIIKIANSTLVNLFVGILLPILATVLCLLVGGIPVAQKMIISVGKPQIIITNVLIIFLVFSIFYLLILFARNTNENKSIVSFISKRSSKRKRHYSLLGGSPLNDDEVIDSNNNNNTNNNRNRNSYSDDPENVVEETSRFVSSADSTDASHTENEAEQNDEYQIMQHISLIMILTFNSLLCFFFQMWIIFDESKSGIFYELELIDLTLLYGQGFFTFLTFGFDSNYIFAPVLFKVKEWLNFIKPFKLPPIESVDIRTREICKKFNEKYKSSCIAQIVKDQRFHYKFYIGVFKGSEFVDWLVKKKLVKTRNQGVNLGRNLLLGRVLHHVSNKRNFHDDFNLYRFNSLVDMN